MVSIPSIGRVIVRNPYMDAKAACSYGSTSAPVAGKTLVNAVGGAGHTVRLTETGHTVRLTETGHTVRLAEKKRKRHHTTQSLSRNKNTDQNAVSDPNDASGTRADPTGSNDTDPTGSNDKDPTGSNDTDPTGSNDTGNVFFPYCACLNDRIHKLHMEVLNGVPGAEFEIDRHLLACAILGDMFEPSVVHRAPNTGNSEVPSHTTGWITLRITCLCEDPSHTMYATKKDFSPAYNEPPLPSKAHRDPVGSRDPQRIVTLSVKDFISIPQNTVQYGLLPDIGRFLQAALQKRYWVQSCRKNATGMRPYIPVSSMAPQHQQQKQYARLQSRSGVRNASNAFCSHVVTQGGVSLDVYPRYALCCIGLVLTDMTQACID